MTTQQTSLPSRVPNKEQSLLLEGRWLSLARLGWLLISISAIALFILGVPLRFQELTSPCLGDICPANQLTPEAIAQLPTVGMTLNGYAILVISLSTLLLVVYGIIGLLIFWLRSNEWIALISSLWLITFGATIYEGEVRAVATTYPALQLPVTFLILLGGIILLHLFFFIFPNGRFVPKWTRWLWLITVFIFFLIYIAASLPGREGLYESAQSLWVLMLLVSIGTQIYRYRTVSGPGERQQTKWVLTALLLTFLGMSSLLFLWLFFPSISTLGIENPLLEIIPLVIGTFSLSMIPLGIGFSIFRYRLWDIDIIIRRTAQYAVVTAVLLLVYFGSVTLLQGALTGLTGSQSPLVIVISTLLIAALFNPLRRRVQAFIDRRFYRNNYDAAQMLARFAQTARDEVDIDFLSGQLVTIIQETLEPESTSLWIKPVTNRNHLINGKRSV